MKAARWHSWWHDRWDRRRDQWRRLRRPLRLALGTLLLGIVGMVTLLLSPRSDRPVSAPVSVRLAGPPQLAKGAKDTPSDAAVLGALLNDRTPLPAAPRDDLLATAPEGRVPRKGEGGSAAWQAYARPAPTLPAATPRLAILLVETGLFPAATRNALALPSAVTLALDSGAPDPAGQIAAARAAGHEVAFDLPLSPAEAGSDLGPDMLHWDDPATVLLHKLRLWLARSPGAFAYLSHEGQGFTGTRRALIPLLQDLALRGLGWIAIDDDSLAAAGGLQLPAAAATLTLDTIPNETSITARFKEAVAGAQQEGRLLLLAHASPVTLQALAELLPTLPAAGVALVPASALLTIKAAGE